LDFTQAALLCIPKGTPLSTLSSVLTAEPISLQLFGNYTGYLFITELSSKSPPLCTQFSNTSVHITSATQFSLSPPILAEAYCGPPHQSCYHGTDEN